jgi:hypothetical protein
MRSGIGVRVLTICITIIDKYSKLYIKLTHKSKTEHMYTNGHIKIVKITISTPKTSKKLKRLTHQ